MKKEPWRYVVSGLSFAYIIFLWVRKDIGGIWASMPAERLLPMAVISIAVTVLKVALIAGGAFLLKWILRKLKK